MQRLKVVKENDEIGEDRLVQWGKRLQGFTRKNKAVTMPVRLPLTRTEQGFRDVELKMPWNVVELSFADGQALRHPLIRSGPVSRQPSEGCIMEQ